MKYLSVCSGIEAATVAWHSFGWKPAAFSEIDKFPAAVLEYHYPTVSNLGDMLEYKEWAIDKIDILVGGTPCQSFSVAGQRKGLDDSRGNLALVYLRIAERFRPRWILWENVHGILSSNRGRDFGTFLGKMGKLGYGYAFRVLNAQYFGVPQRRRRVFVVGYLGDWRPPAAVLVERHSLSRNTKKGKKTRTNVASLTATGVGTCGADDNQGQAGHLIASPLTTRSAEAVDSACSTTVISGCLTAQMSKGINSDCTTTLVCHGTQDLCVGDNAFALGRNNGQENVVFDPFVRKLTPIECERLQGFPDNYTQIPWRGKLKENCPNGHRYKAVGNSMAVPVMKWLGKRIKTIDNVKVSNENRK